MAESDLQAVVLNENNSDEETKNPQDVQRESQITEKKKFKFGDGIRSIKDKIRNTIDERKERKNLQNKQEM